MEQRQIQRQLKTDLLMSGLALVSISIGLCEIGCPRPMVGMTSLDWLDLGIVAVFIGKFGPAVRRGGGIHLLALSIYRRPCPEVHRERVPARPAQIQRERAAREAPIVGWAVSFGHADQRIRLGLVQNRRGSEAEQSRPVAVGP
jgi:hypothetical protein